MKQLFFSLLLLLSFSVQSQTTYIKCVSYQNFKSSDCQGCGIKEGVFAGLILESSSGIKHALHSPFQVKYSRNNVTITDAYGTIVTRPVASLVMRGAEGRNLNTFLSDCLCNPSTHYVKAITGDFVDLTNPMMPVIDIDSSQILPAGGIAGAVLRKSSGSDYDVEWATEPKVYVALLTQTGTDAPVATVLKNTLGGTVVWTRTIAGAYYGTLVGAFTENKTWHSPISQSRYDYGGSANNTILIERISANQIRILIDQAETPIDLSAISQSINIKIEVYP